MQSRFAPENMGELRREGGHQIILRVANNAAHHPARAFSITSTGATSVSASVKVMRGGGRVRAWKHALACQDANHAYMRQ